MQLLSEVLDKYHLGPFVTSNKILARSFEYRYNDETDTIKSVIITLPGDMTRVVEVKDDLTGTLGG